MLDWVTRALQKRLDEISAALAWMEKLRDETLRDHCKFVVNGLLISLDYSLAAARNYYVDYRPKDKVILECLRTILRTGVRLRGRLGRTRTMLLFPSLLSRASRRTLQAAHDYGELVSAIRCCNSKLPESATPLPAFEITLP